MPAGDLPVAHRRNVQADSVTISVSYGPLDATFTGRFGEDGDSFSGAGGRTPARVDQADGLAQVETK